MFIIFEGLDGSGKTTQVEMLNEHFSRQHKKVVAVREPGGTAFGEKVRSVLLNDNVDEGAVELSNTAEALLFAASRAQLVHEVIKPALKDPQNVVIADRFFYSTIAYQGVAMTEGMNASDLHIIATVSASKLTPDFVFLLDLYPENALQRLKSRQKDKYDVKDLRYFRSVHQNYHNLAKREANFHILDAMEPSHVLHDKIVQIVENPVIRF